MPERGESCPACHAGAAYRLGDGRRKCRRCGRRYSPCCARSRLPSATLRWLALCFWQMVPARQAARALGVNRKTVQRHYALLRLGIGGEGRESPVSEWPAGAERPLAALIFEGEEIRVVDCAAGDGCAAPCALVYGGAGRPAAAGGLDDLRLWLPATGEGGGRNDAIVRFWGFAGRLARLCRRHNLRDVNIFLQEVAFRVNRRDDPQVIATLCRLMEGG